MARNKEFTLDERQLFDEAREFQKLSRLPAWKKLLDALAAHADSALGELRVYKLAGGDATTKVIEWREREAVLAFVQDLVLGPIERRDNLVREILVQRGMTEEQIEKFISEYYDEGEIPNA